MRTVSYAAALSLAIHQCITSQTCCLLCHWHHFWAEVGASLRVVKVESAENTPNMFTKGLPHEVFERLRKKLMGW